MNAPRSAEADSAWRPFAFARRKARPRQLPGNGLRQGQRDQGHRPSPQSSAIPETRANARKRAFAARPPNDGDKPGITDEGIARASVR